MKTLNLIDQNANFFDPKSDFYTDICTPFTSEIGTDMTLHDRTETYTIQVSLCEKGCQIIDLVDKGEENPRSLCQCNFKTDLIKNENYYSFIYEKTEGKDEANINVLKCGSTAFNAKVVDSNFVFWFFIFFIIIFAIVAAVIYFCGKNSVEEVLKIKKVVEENENENERPKNKEKYEKYFNEKLTIYDNTIKKILNINYIPKAKDYNIIINNDLKELADKMNIKICENYQIKLKKIIYNWYVDKDYFLLKFLAGRGAFRQDIYPNCILCKKNKNSVEHVINNCPILEKYREEINKKINKSNLKKDLLETIKYIYYTREINNNKEKIKEDKKEINLIKDFIQKMYKEFGKYIKKTKI